MFLNLGSSIHTNTLASSNYRHGVGRLLVWFHIPALRLTELRRCINFVTWVCSLLCLFMPPVISVPLAAVWLQLVTKGGVIYWLELENCNICIEVLCQFPDWKGGGCVIRIWRKEADRRQESSLCPSPGSVTNNTSWGHGVAGQWLHVTVDFLRRWWVNHVGLWQSA